jgi:hypothetical protein
VRLEKRKPTKHSGESVSAEEKLARLLGILVVKDIEQKTEQVTLLRSIGFEVAEVAAMLRMTENHVNVAAHHGRKNPGKKKAKK